MVQHIAGGATTAGPGNSTNNLSYVYQRDARLIPMQTIAYYVRNNSLWRAIGTNTPEELVEGVQALQIVYGEDTDADRIVNNYVAADAVNQLGQHRQRVGLLLVRSEQTGTDIDSQTYNLLGTNVGPFNDRRQRMLFVTTAALRTRCHLNPVSNPMQMQFSRTRESGAILVISLLLLLVMTLLGIAAMQTTGMEERMAGNTRNINLAFQGAEAGLRDAEDRIRIMVTRPDSCSAPAVRPCGSVTSSRACRRRRSAIATRPGG